MKLTLYCLIFGSGCFLSFVSGNSGIERSKTEDFFQDDDSTRIYWKDGISLSWNDFQGKQDTLSKYSAVTYSTVEIKPVNSGTHFIEYNMVCYFEKQLSWSRNKNSNSLLKHEQLHFDISELTTRKMRHQFLSKSYPDKKSAKEAAFKLFHEEEKERAEMGRKYDLETNHGQNAKEQLKWEKRISDELKKLSKYSVTTVRAAW